MKRPLLICALLWFAAPASAGAPPPPPTGAIAYSGGNGETAAAAILIVGAKDELETVKAEYDWIIKNLPGAEKLSQELVRESDRAYDVLRVQLLNGRVRNVYFDVTEFSSRF